MCDRSVQWHIISLVPDSKIDNMLDMDIDNHLSLILSYINSKVPEVNSFSNMLMSLDLGIYNFPHLYNVLGFLFAGYFLTWICVFFFRVTYKKRKRGHYFRENHVYCIHVVVKSLKSSLLPLGLPPPG